MWDLIRLDRPVRFDGHFVLKASRGYGYNKGSSAHPYQTALKGPSARMYSRYGRALGPIIRYNSFGTAKFWRGRQASLLSSTSALRGAYKKKLCATNLYVLLKLVSTLLKQQCEFYTIAVYISYQIMSYQQKTVV